MFAMVSAVTVSIVSGLKIQRLGPKFFFGSDQQNIILTKIYIWRNFTFCPGLLRGLLRTSTLKDLDLRIWIFEALVPVPKVVAGVLVFVRGLCDC